MSSPARTAWNRNDECIASRTTSFPRNENDRLEMPPLVRDAGAALLDQRQRVQEGLRVPVVLGDAGGHGEHVGVEHDVLGGEPGLLGEQVVGAAADGHLALGGVRLALLVERHHHHAGAVLPDVPGLLEERLLALLEADGVDHALALQALEPGPQHAPP